MHAHCGMVGDSSPLKVLEGRTTGEGPMASGPGAEDDEVNPPSNARDEKRAQQKQRSVGAIFGARARTKGYHGY